MSGEIGTFEHANHVVAGPRRFVQCCWARFDCGASGNGWWALIVGGILIWAETDWTVDDLGAEQDYAWVPIVAGAVAVLGSLLTPRRHQRVTGIPVVG